MAENMCAGIRIPDTSEWAVLAQSFPFTCQLRSSLPDKLQSLHQAGEAPPGEHMNALVAGSANISVTSVSRHIVVCGRENPEQSL